MEEIMSDIHVGDAPMRYIKRRSLNRCPKCGAFLVDEIPAPVRKQLNYEFKKGRTHTSKTYCSRCNYKM